MRISDWSSDVCSSDLVVERDAHVDRQYANQDTDDLLFVDGTDTQQAGDQERRRNGRQIDKHRPARQDGAALLLACQLGQSSHRALPVELGYVGRREAGQAGRDPARSEEHTSELQSLMRISYAVFCLKK